MSAPATFRQTFGKVDPNFLRWFPGHMAKGLKIMQQTLRSFDLVIEVHDSRIPISGRNRNFQALTGVKPHILILNKVDLTDQKYNDAVVNRFKKQGISAVLYTNCKSPSCPGIKKLLPTVQELVYNSPRYNRQYAEDISLMIFGVPNVGKSSLLNLLRSIKLQKGSASPVGAIAGITRTVQNRVKISEIPPIYVWDTPGILEPSLPNTEAALRLAACSSLQDHLVGEVLIADYMLYWLNKNNNFTYVQEMQLDKPYDSVDIMLVTLAVKAKLYEVKRDVRGGKKKMPNMKQAAISFIKAFREGRFGPIMLDTDLI